MPRKPSLWVEFVKEYSKKNGLTYFCALTTEGCKVAYQKFKEKGRASVSSVDLTAPKSIPLRQKSSDLEIKPASLLPANLTKAERLAFIQAEQERLYPKKALGMTTKKMRDILLPKSSNINWLLQAHDVKRKTDPSYDEMVKLEQFILDLEKGRIPKGTSLGKKKIKNPLLTETEAEKYVNQVALQIRNEVKKSRPKQEYTIPTKQEYKDLNKQAELQAKKEQLARNKMESIHRKNKSKDAVKNKRFDVPLYF